MYGAILGDMIGALYEFDRGNKSKDFEIFNDKVGFTDVTWVKSVEDGIDEIEDGKRTADREE